MAHKPMALSNTWLQWAGDDMTFVQFEVFVAVVEAGSFTKAGEQLNMTQSAVSQAIHSLESELGVTLLIRNRNGVSLTHIGERMLTHVREVLYKTRCMKEEASASRGLDTGSLRIGCISSVSGKLLPGIIRTFRNRYPAVNLVLFEGSQDEVVHWLESSTIDIALITLSGDLNFDTTPVLRDQMYVVVPETHRLAAAQAVSASELQGEPLIMPVDDPNHTLEGVFKANNVVPKVSFTVRETSTILAMVQEGIGITVLPSVDIPENQVGIRRLVLEAPVYRVLGLGVRAMGQITPTAAEFILHAKDHVRACQPESTSKAAI